MGSVIDVLAATVGERAVHVVRAGQQRQVGQAGPERTVDVTCPSIAGIARARIGEIDARRSAHRDRYRRALHVRTGRRQIDVDVVAGADTDRRLAPTDIVMSVNWISPLPSR